MILDPPAVRIFKHKKSGTILTLFYTALFALGTLACLYATVDTIVDGAPTMLILILPVVLLFGVATWAQLEDLTHKLIIESDRFVYSTVFQTQHIDFDKVKGYRFYFQTMRHNSHQNIEIHRAGDKEKIISLNDDINDFGVLSDWLEKHFPDVSSLMQAEEKKEMMENPDLGADKAVKIQFIKNARTASYIVNSVGVGAAVLLFLLDLTIFNVAAAILVLPLCVVVVVYFKGIIYYNNKTDSEHPYVILGLLATCFGLFSKGILLSFDLVSYSTVPWLTITLIAFGLGSILLLTTIEFSKWTSLDIANVVSFFFALWLMSLGSFFITNQILDNSPAKEIPTTVTGLRGGSAVVDFKPGGKVTDSELEIETDVYKKIKAGDTIVLRVFSGRWGSAWYRIGERSE